MGPGGIGARISRHIRTEKKIFWHIDYLVINPSVKVFALFRAESKWKMECDVNKSIVSNFDVSIVSGFGSTDCKAACGGHLLFLRDTGFQICLKGIGEAYLASGLNPVSTLV
jgi:Uri superfamily endonuclease